MLCNISITSYYKTPKNIRLTCSHNIIFESPSKRKNGTIGYEQGLDKKAYKRSFKNEHDFLYIEKNQKDCQKEFYGEL